MVTGSKLLFGIITGNCYTTESLIVVIIVAIREEYNQRIFSNFALTNQECNIAKPFSKIIHFPLLQKVMQNVNCLSSSSDQTIYFGGILELTVTLHFS